MHLDIHPTPSVDKYTPTSCSSYCIRCGRNHSLLQGLARGACLNLMKILADKKRIDFHVSDEEAEPHMSTDYLFGKARGQMFGILACLDTKDSVTFLKAFSGQYNGVWEVDGWAPPLFDVTTLNRISRNVENKIKKLGSRINLSDFNSPQRKELVRQRKCLSQKLMKDIHSLYSLTNFNGETRSLYDVFTGTNGIPSGTGDCCAPKLLNYAAANGMVPIGLAEFYWGRENRSASRKHGRFYPSCKEKCLPILGFMLCGLEDL